MGSHQCIEILIKHQTMSRFSNSRKMPEKTSLLHILHRNFRYLDRNIFLHRFIYIGEIPNSIDSSIIIENFEKSIKPINDRYNDEPITGFLVQLGNYFCHVLEASEESFVRHLKLLNENDILKSYFDRFKLIMIYHHMNQRFIDEWVPIKVNKESNHDEMEITEKLNLKENFLKIKMLIEKLYAIGNSLKGKVEESKAEMRASKQRLRHFPSLTASHAKISIDFNLLPQVEELKFLIRCDCNKPLRSYLEIYNKIPFLMEDKTWPGRCNEIPMNVFEENVNHVEELSINQSSD